MRSIAIVANPDKLRAKHELPRLKDWLKRRKIRSVSPTNLSSADAVITLGGDGTILAIAARAAESGVPVFGVNLGRLGFMTAVEVGRMYTALDEWLTGHWITSERLMLEVMPPRSKKPVLALNEAVIRVGSSTRMTAILVSIDSENLGRFTGDGVIVATPTGSTAYSLAAQGPVIHPEVEAMVLTPVCAHSFTQRPVVFPAHLVMKLTLADQRTGSEVHLCLDGQKVFALKPNDQVTVRRSKHKLQLLQDPKMSYFHVLREKLSWGGR